MVAVIHDKSLPLRIFLQKTEIGGEEEEEEEEDNEEGSLLWLFITGPLVFVGVILILFFLLRKNNPLPEQEVNNVDQERLVGTIGSNAEE